MDKKAGRKKSQAEKMGDLQLGSTPNMASENINPDMTTMKPFPFLSLPPEIRQQIYTLHLADPDNLQMATYQPHSGRRRAVQLGFEDPAQLNHIDATFNPTYGKWSNYRPSNFALVQVCREVAAEALPVMYGANTFEFLDLGDLEVWLEDIGSMARFVRHVEITGWEGYTWGRRGPVFDALLMLAPDLRSLEIGWRLICAEEREVGRTSLEEFMADVVPLVREIGRRLERGGEDKGKAVEVVKVRKGDSCLWRESAALGEWKCYGLRWHGVACRSKRETIRCQEVAESVRAMLLEGLEGKDVER